LSRFHSTLRLLDLHDHLGVEEHLVRRLDDAGASFLVDCVIGENAGSGAGLDDDLVAASRQLTNRARHKADAKLVTLDFCRDADPHSSLL